MGTGQIQLRTQHSWKTEYQRPAFIGYAFLTDTEIADVEAGHSGLSFDGDTFWNDMLADVLTRWDEDDPDDCGL